MRARRGRGGRAARGWPRGSPRAARSSLVPPGYLCSSWTGPVRSSPRPGSPIVRPVFLGKKAGREAPRLLAQAQSGLVSCGLSWPSRRGRRWRERRADLSRQSASVSFIACKVLTPSSSVWAPQPPAPATVSLLKPRQCGFRTALKDPSTYGTGGGYALRTDLGLCAFEQVGE